MADLDAQYGEDEVRMRRLSDSAGVLRLKERKKAVKWFDQFEASFPQLFFSVYFGALDDRLNIRQFGLWLLNHGAFEDVDLSRPNDGGVLLVVDVNSKAAFIANGYLLDVYLKEEDSFRALSSAHPHLLQGNYYRALKSVMKSLSAALRKRSRQANRNPEKYQRLVGQPHQEMGDILQRIRSVQPSENSESATEPKPSHLKAQ
ncbi:TPM domain-containing protein [Verrucomicrobiaceae bacterium 5K15]|uniref:TPM domain-containing protein n=1 Tax=Oceaniferula flava TaxID=2800421 RepID=A0AAE2VA28_9BACT|nr:TPM domain-containing protein [Oceaniferula flavus]MBK1856183.1 TPM domain-containing protein [Oceaniferula flavus]MBM1137490.1 TPM domain-containing protein [Oceaniferula flavus]